MALATLLDNAVKYSPRGGQIRMSLGRIDDDADLTVAASGPGIPAEDRERVLERIVRLDTSRGDAGSGLGLRLVAAVAKQHDVPLAPAYNPPPPRPSPKGTLPFPTTTHKTARA